jgi:hypothetical protein
VNPRTFLVLTFLISAFALVAHAQTVSPDGSSITPNSGGSLVTSDGTWTFGTTSVAWGTQILLDGQPAGTGVGVELTVAQGKIYSYVGGDTPGWYVWQNAAWVQTTAPQTSNGTSQASPACTGTLTDYYQPSIATPTGYGASYDLFSSQHELEVLVQNCPNNALTMTAGSNQSNQYVYHQGYIYQSSAWQPVTFTSSSNLISNAWYTGSAQATLSGVDASGWNYVVGYVCAWSGSAWLCGCANTTCTTSFWQLQAFENTQVANGGGSNGSGAGGQWAGSPDPNAIVVAPNGNDGNPCNVNSPCQSLGRAQQVAQGATDKTIYLRAGMYNLSSTISLSSGDSGETWMTYPGDAVDSAVLDGGTSTGDAFDVGAPNVTINGIKMQNFTAHTILVDGGSNSLAANGAVIENCEIASMTVAPPVENAAAVMGIAVSRAQNVTVRNNYVHDVAGEGIGGIAYNLGDSIDKLVVTGNVVLRSIQQEADAGAIGMGMHGNNNNGGHVTISNNFIRDWGAPGYDSLRAIYLDDASSNVTVSGNVIGPPTVGVTATFFQCVFVNGGDLDTISGNICDLGATSRQYIADFTNPGGGGSIFFNWTSPNVFSDNIVISNYAGAMNTNDGSYPGVEYVQAPGYPNGFMTIENNVYHNYGGGAENTSGNLVSDGNPINEDPQISGYLYTIAAGSPVYNSPVNFPHILGGWGPPGFIIPSSSNHSDP